jgi:hypothetical protein
VKLRGRFDRAGRVVSEQRRHFQRHPAIHAGGCIVDWAKEIGSLRQIFNCKFEEQPLTGLSFNSFPTNRIVIEA